MSEQQFGPDEVSEDDGVLEPADSLETDELSWDPLDTGLAAMDRWSSAEGYGTTLSEPGMLAHDVGIDGGAASAEEAAVHLVPDDPAEDGQG